MELVKDIYFNTDKLVENTNVKVSYTGKFYQGNNEKVYLHYGYGKDWNNLNEIEMKKTDLGYQAELNLLSGGETLNFCFKNQNNEWDNNSGNNYIFDIEKSVDATQQLKGTNLVFWGKSFGKKEESQTSPNLYWTSENTTQIGNNALNIDDNSSGIIEDITKETPNSVDAVITNKADSIADDNCFKIIAPTFENSVSNLDSIQQNSLNIEKNITSTVVDTNAIVPDSQCITDTNIINTITSQQETSIALAPTGFNYWTKKIKDTVCKFFAYVPKLISGNYKRNLAKNKTQD